MVQILKMFDAYLDIETSEGAKPTMPGRHWLCYWNIIGFKSNRSRS